jgi:hypothetical protein
MEIGPTAAIRVCDPGAARLAVCQDPSGAHHILRQP